MTRRIIQIATMPAGHANNTPLKGESNVAALYALCDDGSLWAYGEGCPWKQLVGIPQQGDEVPA
jgi:hypothetical protein